MWYVHTARMFYKERDPFEDLSGLAAHKEMSNLTAYKIHVVPVLLQLSASKWHRKETVSLRGKSLPSSFPFLLPKNSTQSHLLASSGLDPPPSITFKFFLLSALKRAWQGVRPGILSALRRQVHLFCPEMGLREFTAS